MTSAAPTTRVRSPDIFYIALILICIMTLTGVSSQTLKLNSPKDPPTDSVCDAGFAAGIETFEISGTADSGGLTEWDGLVISLEYADGQRSLCTISKSLGCQTSSSNDCYCTKQMGNSYDFVFNITASTALSGRIVRLKWISSNFNILYSNSQTLLEMYDPSPSPDTVEVSQEKTILKKDQPDKCEFEIDEGSTASVTFCVGEAAPSYTVTVEFEGSVVGSSSDSIIPCIIGTFHPAKLPGKLTSNYTKDGGCYRKRRYTCTLIKKEPAACDTTCISLTCILMVGVIANAALFIWFKWMSGKGRRRRTGLRLNRVDSVCDADSIGTARIEVITVKERREPNPPRAVVEECICISGTSSQPLRSNFSVSR